MIPPLPFEIWYIVFQNLRDDHPTLYACSYVCKGFLSVSRFNLFRNIVLSSYPRSTRQLAKLLKDIRCTIPLRIDSLTLLSANFHIIGADQPTGRFRHYVQKCLLSQLFPSQAMHYQDIFDKIYVDHLLISDHKGKPSSTSSIVSLISRLHATHLSLETENFIPVDDIRILLQSNISSLWMRTLRGKHSPLRYNAPLLQCSNVTALYLQRDCDLWFIEWATEQPLLTDSLRVLEIGTYSQPRGTNIVSSFLKKCRFLKELVLCLVRDGTTLDISKNTHLESLTIAGFLNGNGVYLVLQTLSPLILNLKFSLTLLVSQYRLRQIELSFLDEVLPFEAHISTICIEVDDFQVELLPQTKMDIITMIQGQLERFQKAEDNILVIVRKPPRNGYFFGDPWSNKVPIPTVGKNGLLLERGLCVDRFVEMV